jgi:type II secretory pathway pseudopilin PulG
VAFSSHSARTREVALRNDLRTLRSQITLYQLQHGRTPDGDRLEALLVGKSDPEGQTGIPEAVLGPYMSGFPTNPFNGRRSVKVIGPDQDMTPDEQYGWIYRTDGNAFKVAASTNRLDSAGTAICAY